ncbi:NAD(P)-binding protein [Xylariaceae sp. FL1272]|nr:NAD(P)-binding protein [Xylariaceae sp. FL1272]
MSTTPECAIYGDLQGKIALIMGIGQARTSSSNIWGNGAAIAWALHRSGALIFGCDINIDNAEHTAERIRKTGGTCNVMSADATSAEGVAKVVDAVMVKYGRIDILVNNVGMTAAGNAGTLSEGTWDHQLNLNLKSVYLSCHAVLPIMEKQGSGCIVNNASIAGLRYLGKPQVAYATAKAAVIHFTRVTAIDYAEKGVRLNCVAPGLMFVPLVERMGQSRDPGEREAFRKITEHNVPTGKMGTAFDVANAAAFLASDAAKYITGQTLVVDGGLTSSTGTGFEARL